MVTAWMMGCLMAVSPSPAQTSAAPAAPGNADPAAASTTLVAVLDLKANGVEEALVQNLTAIFTTEAGRVPGLKVIGRAEVRDIVGYEIEKQTLGCAEATCFTEIGGALGAERIVSGSVGQVGATFVINLRLIDVVKVQTQNRLAETIAGRPELLPDAVRVLAWRLFSQPVPAEVTAAYEATRARLAAQDAQAAGDATALAAAQKALADAERTRAEAERLRAEAVRERDQALRPSDPAAPDQRVRASPRPWAHTARTLSATLGGLGVTSGAVLQGLAYYWATEKVGTAKVDPYSRAKVFPGSQRDAQTASRLRQAALGCFAAGGAGVLAAVVFSFLDAEPDTATALRLTPTVTGLAMEF